MRRRGEGKKKSENKKKRDTNEHVGRMLLLQMTMQEKKNLAISDGTDTISKAFDNGDYKQ